MDVEIRSLPAASRRQLQGKVKDFRDAVGTLKTDFNRAKSSSERSDLVAGGGKRDNLAQSSTDQRARMAATTDKMSKQNSTLENSLRVVAETTEVAIGITEELGRNREKIQSSHNKVREVSGMNLEARKILRGMAQRDVQHKVRLWGTLCARVEFSSPSSG